MALDMTRQQLWQRAAQRALASDLTSDLVRRGNAVLVPSTTTDGKRYRVRLVGNRVGPCSCEAGLNGRPCKHRAAVALRVYEKATGTRVVAVKPAGAALLGRYLYQG